MATNWKVGDELTAARLNATGAAALRPSQQATPNMTVLVAAGVARFTDRAVVKYAGGSSGTFTAPGGANEKRIDLLLLKDDGTLEIIQGTATTGTPSAPTYPAGKFVICEVFLRNGATSIKDTDDTTNGYISLDVRYFIGDGTPTGTVAMFGASTIPNGWLECDGAAVSRTTYANLFAAISTAFGAGDGSTTFNLPNLKGRTPVGLDAAQTEFDVMGETGGAKTHTLVTAEMPAHTHALNVSGGTAAAPHLIQQAGFSNDPSGATFSTGGGGAHNNLQPYIILKFMIKT